MNFRKLNENFTRLYEAGEFESVPNAHTDIKVALTDAAIDVMSRGDSNIKSYEIAFQDVINKFYPDNSWWEVCDLNIFEHLFTERDPFATIAAIVANIHEPEAVFSEEEEVVRVEELLEKRMLKESISKVLSRLNEAEMPDEDKADSAALKGILDKIKKRVNAKLTPDEQRVMDKYSLTRYEKNLYSSDDNGKLIYNRPLKQRADDPAFSSGRRFDNGNENKINYADRARKAKDRYEANTYDGVDSNGTSDTIMTSTTNRHEPKKFKQGGTYLDKQRAMNNSQMSATNSQMKSALRDRRYAKNRLANAQSDYDDEVAKAETEYDNKVKQAQSYKDFITSHSQRELDSSNKTVNKLLKRDKKEESLEKRRLKEDIKIYRESDLTDFEFWSGAKDRVKYLTDAELRQISSILEESYPEGMTETEVNDIFWFEDDWIAEMLGYESFEDLIEERDEKNESLKESTEKYFTINYDSNGRESAVMVKANSEDEAKKVYNKLKGNKYPKIYGVREINTIEANTNKKKGMSVLN